MKKKMKPVLLTLLVLTGLTVGGFYFLTVKKDGPKKDFVNRMQIEQRDLENDRAYQYDMDGKAVELVTAGENKNVLNFDQGALYSVQNSNAARERLNRLIKRTDADFENPIIALNPFGTNENSLYFYFETSTHCMIRYTITVEEESVMDHVRYVNNGQEDNLAKTHEFVVSGMVPGRDNYIIIEMLDSAGTKRESRTYKYTMPVSDVLAQLKVEQGYSKETSKTGMFFVLPKNTNRILCYDNRGVLRNVTKTETSHGRRFYQFFDSVLYQVADDKVAKVSRIGQVTGVAQVKGYGKIKDFSYDGYNEIYSIGTKKGRDYLLATAMDSGKTRVVYRFPKGVRLGSLSIPQGGMVMMTGIAPSGIIVMDAITSSHPKISYVLGKKSAWKKKVAKKKIVEDKEVVMWDTRQSLLNASDSGSGEYSMTVVKQGKVSAVSWTLDKKKKEVKLSYCYPFGGNAANPSQIKGDNMIYTDITSGVFEEFDKEGKGIRKISLGSSVDAVVKVTLGNMCFYGI